MSKNLPENRQKIVDNSSEPLSFWATKEMLDDWKAMGCLPKEKISHNKSFLTK